LLPCSTARSCDSLRAAAWRSAGDFYWLKVVVRPLWTNAPDAGATNRSGVCRRGPLRAACASAPDPSRRLMHRADRPHRRPVMNTVSVAGGSSSPGASLEVCSPSAHAAGAALNKRRHLLFHPATALARPCGFSGADSQRCEEPGHSSNRSCVLRDVPGPLLAFARPGRTRFTRMRIRQRSWGFSLFAAFPSCGSCGISARSTHLPFHSRRTGILAGGSADVSWFTFT